MGDAVTYERRREVGVLRLERGENRNAMTPELLDAFAAASAAARADAGARCIVVTGSGSCFSAGADLKASLQRGGDAAPHERSYAMYEPFLSLLDIEVPVVAALNGHAVGGGFGLALVCDVRIGNRDAKYGANFTRLGIAPGMAISYLLPRLVGVSRASELLYTGRLIKGDEAERIGLLSEAVAADQVLPRAMALAETIAESAPLAVKLTKEALRRGLGWDVRAAARAEAHAQAASLDTEDAAEGIRAAREKRPPRFSGR